MHLILSALSVKLTITAKSTLYEIFVDGSPVPRCHCNDASFPEEIELQPDSQLIAVTAIDTTGTCAGILASTTNDSLVTNPTWKCTTDPPPHWYTLGFDDTAWSDAYAIGPNHNVTWPADCSNNALQGIDSISANAFWIWTPSILETPFYDYIIHCRAYLRTLIQFIHHVLIVINQFVSSKDRGPQAVCCVLFKRNWTIDILIHTVEFGQ